MSEVRHTYSPEATVNPKENAGRRFSMVDHVQPAPERIGSFSSTFASDDIDPFGAHLGSDPVPALGAEERQNARGSVLAALRGTLIALSSISLGIWLGFVSGAFAGVQAYLQAQIVSLVFSEITIASLSFGASLGLIGSAIFVGIGLVILGAYVYTMIRRSQKHRSNTGLIEEYGGSY